MSEFADAEGRMAWFNGEFVPLEQISISPFDRGFLFGDGVYEGLRWYPGSGVFRFSQHLARLKVSLDTLRIEGVDLAQFEVAVPELVRRNELADRDATIYLQVTRGVAPRTHHFPDPAVPSTRMALVRSFDPPRREQEEGIDAVLVQDLRWGRCDIKSVALLANVLAKEDAVRAGAQEAIFVRDGCVIEGSHTAVIAVLEGSLIAPPNGPQILPSVTREVVLEMAAGMGIGIELRNIECSELGQLDELLVLGTSTEVMGVIRVDGRPVGAGVVGPLTRRLQAAWPPAS